MITQEKCQTNSLFTKMLILNKIKKLKEIFLIINQYLFQHMYASLSWNNDKTNIKK